MKKYIYITGMILSMISFTACGQKSDNIEEVLPIESEEQGNVDANNENDILEETNQEIIGDEQTESETLQVGTPVSYEIQASIHEDLPTYRFVANGSSLNGSNGYVMGLNVFDENGNNILSEDFSQVIDDEVVGSSIYNEMMDTMGLHVTDINFDGYKDVIILESFGGAHGNSWYYGYVWNVDDATFVPAPSFTEIANPALDKETKSIYSTGGQGATSNTWTIYQYIDSKFVVSNQLNLEMNDDNYQFVEKKLKDGSLEVVNTKDIQTSDYGEALKTAGYVDDNLWKLEDPHWYGIGGPEASQWLQ